MYNIFLPFIATGAPDKIHSLQKGWGTENVIPAYQDALGLRYGGDQHLLDAGNAMQTVQVEEWYASNPNLDIQPHVLCYSKALRYFRYPDEATAWVKAHPGKRYIIGNEPDNAYSGGGNAMTIADYAEFYQVASLLIREADPTAYLMTAGWAGGIGVDAPHNENDMLRIYYDRYGTMDVQAMAFHVYQNTYYDNPYPAGKLHVFADYVKDWHDLGWIDTTDIALTEFGWSGHDRENNTADNCLKFIDWFMPQLYQHKQIRGFWWWEWGAGAMLMRDGEPTDVGIYYSGLRK